MCPSRGGPTTRSRVSVVTLPRARDAAVEPADEPTSPRWKRPDPLIVAVAVVSAVTYALHGFDAALTRDLALYSYAGQQVADGTPPYLGVLNRAGPLAHVLPGVGAWIARVGGFDDVLTMRLFFLVLAVAGTTMVYVLARDLFASRLAGIVSAATFLGFTGFIHYAADGPREKTPLTLFLVCALWALTRRRWFTAGVFVSLATLCLQIAFFPAFTAVVVGALLLAGGERLRALARIVAGGAIPVAVLAVWFWLVGSLRESVDAFLVLNARYTVPNPPMENLDILWEGSRAVYGWWLWVFVAGLVVLGLRGLSAVVPWVRRNDPSVLVLAALAVGVVTGLLWNLKDFDSWADLFPLLPFAAVGIGSLVPRAVLLLPAPRGPVELAAFVVVGSRDGGALVGDHPERRPGRPAGSRRRGLRCAAAGGARLTSVEAPQPLVLTGRTNPTRHQMFRSGLQDYVDDTWPGGLDGFAGELVEQRPTLVTLGDSTYEYWREAITPDYVCVGAAPGWSWWARADEDPAVLASLRRAAGYGSDDDCARHAASRRCDERGTPEHGGAGARLRRQRAPRLCRLRPGHPWPRCGRRGPGRRAVDAVDVRRGGAHLPAAALDHPERGVR